MSTQWVVRKKLVRSIKWATKKMGTGKSNEVQGRLNNNCSGSIDTHGDPTPITRRVEDQQRGIGAKLMHTKAEIGHGVRLQ